MTDQAEIERWIRDELNRGYDSETVKLQLKQNGYKPNLINGLVDKIAKEKENSNQAGFQYNATNSLDNTQPKPRMQNSSQNKPVTPDNSSLQSNVNRNTGTQYTANSSAGNSMAGSAQFSNMSFIEKVKMIILNPKGFFDIMPQTGGYKDPTIFLSIILVMFAIFSSLMDIVLILLDSTASNALSDSGILLSGVMALVIAPIIFLIAIPFMFLGALFHYILLKIVGGSGDYESTFRVIAYSSVLFLFTWIPLVGIVMWFYDLYITVIGYSKVHNISAIKALMALLIPLIIVFIISLIWIVLIGASILSVFSSMEPPTGAVISYFSDMI